jgi:hypothetical protein
MKTIIIDSGPVITLALNNLLWLLEKVKKRHNIRFCITEAVKREVIDRPLAGKRFKFEALQVMNLMDKGIIEVIEDEKINELAKEFLELANNSYMIGDRPLNIVHFADMSVISAATMYKADAIMLDERTGRYMLEKPDKLRYILSHKLHEKVRINNKAISKLKAKTKNVKIIRSVEFVTIAFEKGLLDEFLPELPDAREILLDGLLWGLKLNGCAISTKDLEKLLRLELKIKK